MRKNSTLAGVSDYTDLIKYKLSLAVTFSSVTGYFIFDNRFDIPLLFLVSGVFLLTSGAAVMNQFSETRFDALMGRTMFRPLPQEKISGRTALFISIGLLFLGILFLYLTGPVPPLLGISAVFIYNVLYTRLKRITPLAIVPGAIVGAIPPLIGYEAAGGGYPGVEIIMFSVFMFLWQLPHFLLILLKYSKEYEAAGFVTLSQLLNEKQIRMLVFLWVLLSTIFLMLTAAFGMIFNGMITAFLLPVNIIFILAFYYLLFLKPGKEETGRAFILINSFNLLIMILFIINSFSS